MAFIMPINESTKQMMIKVYGPASHDQNEWSSKSWLKCMVQQVMIKCMVQQVMIKVYGPASYDQGVWSSKS
ncbi:hypothetical protein Bpfe_014143 [Biomphalaria pfeifferi]|uniref:Uncharacterized protein n=1 Tax=Biomphalaria pfeifferi TaxID=112525 RepID=A0AAD8BLQ5_BIOPF|nr:hypothetical protein Bpfe_014143 [Biomphalaria pfeifferi]